MDNISVLISEEDINKRIKELAEEINRDYEGKEIRIIGILKGSVYFMTELTKHITIPVTFDYIDVSSYGNQMSAGKLVIKKKLDEEIKGLDCIIIEDIIDTGNTLSMLKNELSKMKPASLEICTLLDKPSRRAVLVDVKYKGFEIEDKFVVGCGMDYAQKYRNLTYVGVIEN